MITKETTLTQLKDSLTAIKQCSDSKKYIEFEVSGYSDSMLKILSIINVSKEALYSVSQNSNVSKECSLLDIHTALEVSSQLAEKLYCDIAVLDNLGK